MPWSIELIEKYEDKLFFGGSVWIKGLPSSMYIKGLTDNGALPWSIELIQKYIDKWDWEHLSYNEALPWSIELIQKFKDRLFWGGKTFFGGGCIIKYHGGLVDNKSLPWSIELVEKFKDQLDWKYVLSDANLKFPTLEYEMMCSVLDHHKYIEQNI